MQGLTPTKRKTFNCNLAIGEHVAQTCTGDILQGDEQGHVAVTMEHNLLYVKSSVVRKKNVPTTCCMKIS